MRRLPGKAEILEAERLAEVAAAKGDAPETARINARYGLRKSEIELQNEQAQIDLRKGQLAEQAADARQKELVLRAAEAPRKLALLAGQRRAR